MITSENMKQLDQTLESFFNSKGLSMNWFDDLVKSEIEKTGGTTRESFVSVIKILSEYFEENFDFKLPYTWGGGHPTSIDKDIFKNINRDYNHVDNSNINPNWGAQFNKEELDQYMHSDGTIYTNYGPDCTGLIICALRAIGLPAFNKNALNFRNGYANEKSNEMFVPIGDIYKFNKEQSVNNINEDLFEDFYQIYNDNVYFGRPGDILHRPGHVMIITEVDEINGIFYTTEAKGGKHGVVRTKYNLLDLINSERYCLINISELIQNPIKMLEKYNLLEYKENRNLKKL
ncbi:MAG: hypothetical protein R3Y13_05360 [bacterium]